MAQNTKYKRFLADRNIDQKDVSVETKTTPSTINLFANGYANITTAILKRLVIFHRVSPNDILDWERWIEEDDAKKAAKKAKQAAAKK